MLGRTLLECENKKLRVHLTFVIEYGIVGGVVGSIKIGMAIPSDAYADRDGLLWKGFNGGRLCS